MAVQNQLPDYSGIGVILLKPDYKANHHPGSDILSGVDVLGVHGLKGGCDIEQLVSALMEGLSSDLRSLFNDVREYKLPIQLTAGLRLVQIEEVRRIRKYRSRFPFEMPGAMMLARLQRNWTEELRSEWRAFLASDCLDGFEDPNRRPYSSSWVLAGLNGGIIEVIRCLYLLTGGSEQSHEVAERIKHEQGFTHGIIREVFPGEFARLDGILREGVNSDALNRAMLS